VSKDLPPFTIAAGNNQTCGLKVSVLRRAGVGSGERLELRRAYHALFRSGLGAREAAAVAEKQFESGRAAELVQFVRESKRGVCRDSSSRVEAAD